MCSILTLTPANQRVLLHRARAKLREHLETTTPAMANRRCGHDPRLPALRARRGTAHRLPRRRPGSRHHRTASTPTWPSANRARSTWRSSAPPSPTWEPCPRRPFRPTPSPRWKRRSATCTHPTATDRQARPCDLIALSVATAHWNRQPARRSAPPADPPHDAYPRRRARRPIIPLAGRSPTRHARPSTTAVTPSPAHR